MSGSEIFDTYEQEYATLYNSIIKKVSSIPKANSDQKALLINQTKRELEEADEIVRFAASALAHADVFLQSAVRRRPFLHVLGPSRLTVPQISQMDLEVISMVGPQKAQLARRVKEFKEEMKRARRDLAKPGGQTDRELLLGSAGSSSSSLLDLEAATMDQRGRLLMGTERLQEGSRRLENAKRLALETETMGISTLNDLNTQREQIIRTRDTLNTADTWVTRSQGILRGMQRQYGFSSS
ncbi:hypothetical protein HDU96_001176 [Phlyctochytrium bullatum]|nr:hypothetical protein HDU96_001176 [Phlyctochytrium bullatum]